MHDEHPTFKAPSNIDQIIWRYIDFTKFVDLLNTSALFFTRADYFSDIFEGSLPKQSVKVRTEIDSKMIADGKLLPMYTPEFMAKYGEKVKKEKGINCWHMNNYESAAMWKLYLKSNEGIAIQSTYRKLIDSFSSSEIPIHIGIVKYIDYEKDFIEYNNGFNPFLHKRKSFEHEKELRAIVWSEAAECKNKIDLSTGGCKIEIDIEKLIENIYVSPDSPVWFTKLVQDITEKFGLKNKVVNSRLNDTPIF